MTKLGKFILLIIVAIIGVLIGLLVFDNEESLNIEDNISDEGESLSYIEEADFYSIDMTYPKDPIVLSDAEILVFSRIAEFKKIFDEFSDEDWEVLNNSASGKYGLGLDYTKHDSDLGITTYVFDTYEFTGGAHGNPGVETITYDGEGDRIDIGDILKGDNQNLHAITAMIQDELSSSVEGGIESLFIDGIGPELDNFNKFYFDGGEVVFLFPPYQAGPYVLGTLKARLPFQEVFGYFKKENFKSFYEEFEEEHRGYVTFGGEVQAFRECEESDDYWYHDTTGSLEDEYLHAKLSDEPYEEVPAILNGYIRSIPESESGFAAEYEGILVISDLSQVGGGGVCQ